MRRLADLVLSTLLAPPCAVCGSVLRHPLEGAVCETCWLSVRRITPPVCDACGGPLPSFQSAIATGGRCHACQSFPSAIARARALGDYEGVLRDVVHALKYSHRRSVVPRLASMMRAAGRDVLAGADALVPVPLHPRRRRARGFNQARLLADAIGPPVWDVLQRVRHTTPQVELPADARRTNVEDAFAIGRMAEATTSGLRTIGWRFVRKTGALAPASIHDRILVLVDDVTTTGATLEACARVLKEAGAREVRALTAARVASEPRAEWSR